MKKLIISTDTLKPALAKLGLAVNSKTVLPVLTNLLCKVTPNQMELIATNQEITIYYRMECEAAETFDFLIPFELFTKIVALNRHSPLEIESAKQVKIKSPNNNYNIKVPEKIESFPKLQELPKRNFIELNKEIISGLHTAVSTTAKYEVNQILSHVLIELDTNILTLASSDGSYLVYSKQFQSEQIEKEELLISQRLIKVIEGAENAKLFYHAKAIGFEFENITVVATRSEYKFANFRKYFPEDWPGNLKINKGVLIEALENSALSSDMLRITKITLGAKEIKLKADDHMIDISGVAPADYSGTVSEIVVNSDKFLKLLNQIEHAEITLAIHDAKRPILFLADEDPGYKGMMMPISI